MRKVLLAAFGLDAQAMLDIARQIHGKNLGKLTDEVIQYVFKSRNNNKEALRLLENAKQSAMSAVAGGSHSEHDVRLVRALGKGGDPAAKNVLREVKWTPDQIKTFRLSGILKPLPGSVAARPNVIIAGGMVAAGLLSAASIAATQIDLSSTEE